MNEPQAAGGGSSGSRSSSRRRRHQRPRRTGLRQRLQSPRFDRAMIAIVALATIVFLGLSIKSFNDNVTMLGAAYFLGPTKGETLYMYGPPKRVRTSPDAPWTEVKPSVSFQPYAVWGYTAGQGGAVEIAFDPNSGRTARVSCDDETVSAAACPTMFELAIGDTEDRVAYAIGRPTDEVFVGRDKRMRYDDIGVAFVMRELRIRRMELGGSDGTFVSLVRRYLRFAIP